MRRRDGITHTVWQALTLRQKRLWRWALFAAAVLAAALLGAGGQHISSTLSGLAALVVSQIVVENQRCLSGAAHGHLSEHLVHTWAMVARLAILLLGCGLFLGMLVLVSRPLLQPETQEWLSLCRLPELRISLGLVIMAMILGHIWFKLFREFELEKTFWQRPAVVLETIFIERRYVAASLPELMGFELMIHAAIFGYCMTAGGVAAMLVV